MSKIKTQRFLRGFQYYMREKPKRITTLLLFNERTPDSVDHTVAGQFAAQRIIRKGWPMCIKATMALQRAALDLQHRIERMARFNDKIKIPRLEPCASCQFIAFCKEHEMTCSRFRSYVHQSRPEFDVQVPDKHWDESWWEEDEHV